MRIAHVLSVALIGIAAVAGPGAAAANLCKADTLACPTKMPVGGYCECTAHGKTEGGTSVSKAPPHTKVNATAGGCNLEPGGPGCPRQ